MSESTPIQRPGGRPSRPPRFATIWLTLAALLFAAWPAAADPPAKVDVVYMIVHAHNADEVMDPRLEPVAASLQSLGFSGFKLISSGKWRMAAGETQTLPLEGGYGLQIKVDDIGERDASVTAYISRPDATNPAKIEMTVPANGAFMLGGPDYEEGKLVVPIRVRFP